MNVNRSLDLSTQLITELRTQNETQRLPCLYYRASESSCQQPALNDLGVNFTVSLSLDLPFILIEMLDSGGWQVDARSLDC